MLASSRRSVTLIELLIAISLLAVIILGINNIDIFSRYHFISTDRRAKLQNDVSRCLEHITKSLAQAIGNETAFGSGSAVLAAANTLAVLIDANGNGLRDEGAGDYWVRYKLNTGNHTLSYCRQCPDSACSSCSVSPEESLAKDLTVFSPTIANLISGNYIDVSISACWDPTGTIGSCGSSENPSVSMATSISLPSLASN